ncbi:deoxynucleoside kinase [Staphylococcus sp. SQ8-PEA]|uniref:Deoxynucleoside kinase n=1 Tax=Staphylococcus marylandisciuri TaxID=2981529 RepID=A0ABT2QRN7_9STAP|nr:deoxynucleoside kinase [Staphylococcus marylandisciuri]MCU5746638.1 deoxynucleoside kinase [Staphylococcus marylandisciuri]
MKKTFIAIEGPIGVGKTSLAHQLSKTLDFEEEREVVENNPFLSDFYDDISKWSFQTEMFFLCNRYKQVQDLAQSNKGVVSDYHIFKNKIFAHNTLTTTEFNKFKRIYDILTEDLIMPNIVVFLDADLRVLKTRIAKRNRSFEHQIEDNYLLQLQDDYASFYRSLQAQDVKTLYINTSHLDFVNNKKDYQYILNQIEPMIGGEFHD